ncbi:MAG TPA: glycoside hydrolase family 88 protein [Candidatus Angelobacter sp.]|nr:glycoside hydrolase family 88 protein [Candidatus Angelobacter sp.]
MIRICSLAMLMLSVLSVLAQNGAPVNPDHIAPTYPVPYGPPKVEAITAVLDRIFNYLDTNTPAQLVDRRTQAPITDLSRPDPDAVIQHGAFPIISYEWGVTYSGMLLADENTGDPRFNDYVRKRLQFIASIEPYFHQLGESGMPETNNPLRSVLYPRALDDAGSMCAAMIKAQRAGLVNLQPLIDRYADYVSQRQYRLTDGTLARQRPLPDSLWLDDLYMSVPALAQMGRLTGDRKYYDDAARQIRQFSSRMFDQNKGLYLHGWVEGMAVHPAFYWGRANGWALLAMTELLDVLPEDHPQRTAVLAQLREQVRGLAACQGPNGLWHQLLDRNDSYYETSASAIYTYCIARGIDRGWLDPQAYGPVVILAWNGVARQVNSRGQVEGTCVGTGIGFDPAFYYSRPQSVYAAHGYGPVLLAGAEMIKLLQTHDIILNGGVQFGRPAAEAPRAR